MNYYESNLTNALALASHGFAVIPCKPNKQPYVRGWKAGSRDESQIRSWFQMYPDAMAGLPCGANSLFVVDCDRKGNGKPDGVANWQSLCNAWGIDLSRCFTVETPSGGRHCYYHATDSTLVNTAGKLGPGIDTRGAGGYVIAFGSVFPDGRTYRVLQGTIKGIEYVPEPIRAYLLTQSPVERTPEAIHKPATDRERSYAAKALADESAKLSAETSNRNHALNNAALAMGTMVGADWITRNEVEAVLREASKANGYRAKDGDNAAWNTLQSGLNAGIKNPRLPLTESDPLPINFSALTVKGTPVPAIAPCNNSTPHQSNNKRSVRIRRGTEIVARPVHWLWNDYLPSGKLTILAGAGGTGKSTLALALAAIVTTAGTWPDGTHCAEAGNVVIWSSEDDPNDTIKPRLMAAGADESRYGIIDCIRETDGKERPFDPATDIVDLRDAVIRIGGVSYLIVDPIVSVVSGDMNKTNDVRRSQQPLVDFAAEFNCAVLGITHFGKGTAGRNPAERVIGSQAFAAQARMVLVTAKDEETNNRVLTRAKANNTLDCGGFNYTIDPVILPGGIHSTRVVWGEAIIGSSREILARIENDGGADDHRRLTEAMEFLKAELSNGAVPYKEVLSHAQDAGISEKTLRRAAKQLGVLKEKAGFQGAWIWRLPVDKTLAVKGVPVGKSFG